MLLPRKDPLSTNISRNQIVVSFLILLALPVAAAPKRRAVAHPTTPPLTRDSIIATTARIANRTTIPAFEPRLHWENVPYLEGLLLVAEQTNDQALIARVENVIFGSGDDINSIYWGDGTAFAQVVMDLYRLMPTDDLRRESLVAMLGGPISFAEHTIRVTPDRGAPRDPWWVAGGYGTRFWQDDMYMVISWLAMYGSLQDGLPNNAKARDLAYELSLIHI